MDYKKIGIVIADDMEFLPMKRCAEPFGYTDGEINGYNTISFKIGEREIVAIESRIGKVNAAAATAMLVMKENPDCVLNVGLSGGVKGVNRGTVYTGTQFTECDFDLSPLGFELGVKPAQEYVYFADEDLLSKIPADMNIRRLKCGTGDFFLTKEDMKADFYERFGINTFDMETGAIASVCKSCGVPFMSIRKISDDSEDSAAEDYRQMNTLAETDLSEILIEIIKNM